jgi:hypothetical protein
MMSVTFGANGIPAELEVNMNNRNAAFVAESLAISLDPDWNGDMDASDFQGRVVIALGIAPSDEGMPSYEHNRNPGNCRIIEGSRPAGYLQDRLNDLHAIAVWATENDQLVWWG